MDNQQETKNNGLNPYLVGSSKTSCNDILLLKKK